jgi:NitT/TauT family transport system substrate-binding protein
MGYAPVVTNLACPLVDFVTAGDDPTFEARKFASFSEMGEAFRSGHIQAAFIIAPLAIMLREQGVPLKIVYIGNRHESTLVMGASIQCESAYDLVGKRIAVPLRYSGHLLALRRYLRQNGLNANDVRVVEIPPPEMPAALAAKEIDGYFVGEPFASKSLASGAGKRFLDVESLWPGFICNLLIVRDELIRSHPEWVQRLVSLAAKSGLWAQDHLDETIKIASKYWGQDPRLVEYTFKNTPGRFRFDLFVPIRDELDDLASEMTREGMLGRAPDARSLMDDRFARAVGPVRFLPGQGIFAIKDGVAGDSQARVRQ